MIKPQLLREGTGRASVSLSTYSMGEDLVVYLFNERAHLGAVAVAEYSPAEERTSTSIITRLGHKDDVVASNAARRLCKHLKSPVCVIAGIHLDGITMDELTQITKNCDKLVERLIGNQ